MQRRLLTPLNLFSSLLLGLFLPACAVAAGAVGAYVLRSGLVDEWAVAHTTYPIDSTWELVQEYVLENSVEPARTIDFPREIAGKFEDNFEVVAVVIADDLDHTIIKLRSRRSGMERPAKAEELLQEILERLAPEE